MRAKRLIGAMLVLLLASSSLFTVSSVRAATAAATKPFSMSYLYNPYPDTYVALVDKSNGSLDVVAPSYFDVNADGTLNVTKYYQDSFVKAMHERGVKVVPYLTNHWSQEAGRAALANRELLSTQIANAVKEYNLDGIDIDIENLTEVDRDNYTDFVKLLRSKLPVGKQLSIAVSANPQNRTTGWAGSYDCLALSQYTDYLMLMAYDQSYRGSAAGPVAGLPWVDESIQNLLNLGVSPDKIVLGVPFYGRMWNSDGSCNGDGIPNKRIDDLIQQFGGSIYYDPEQQSPKATFTIPLGNETLLNSWGPKLTAGTYTIWYDNAESLARKLKLANQYHLKGAGSWALSQEADDTWDFYPLWRNGLLYTDTAGHWALPDIYAMAKKGWMVGTSNLTFSPEQSLTRAQAAAILVRVLSLTAPINGQPRVFKDINASHWAKASIDLVAQHGLMTGVAPGVFGTEDPLTREQMAAILDRAFPSNEWTPTTGYTDLRKDHWAYGVVMAAKQRGLMGGYPDGSFGLGKPILRGEMAALLNRLMK